MLMIPQCRCKTHFSAPRVFQFWFFSVYVLSELKKNRTNFHNSEIGDGQPRMCRSMNKLIAWGQEPERHACYHRWSDYYPRVTNIIEMYAFCEKGSNNEKVANAYFEGWGHKSPYDDGMVLGKDVMNYDDHIARNGREKEIED